MRGETNHTDTISFGLPEGQVVAARHDHATGEITVMMSEAFHASLRCNAEDSDLTEFDELLGIDPSDAYAQLREFCTKMALKSGLFRHNDTRLSVYDMSPFDYQLFVINALDCLVPKDECRIIIGEYEHVDPDRTRARRIADFSFSTSSQDKPQ